MLTLKSRLRLRTLSPQESLHDCNRLKRMPRRPASPELLEPKAREVKTLILLELQDLPFVASLKFDSFEDIVELHGCMPQSDAKARKSFGKRHRLYGILEICLAGSRRRRPEDGIESLLKCFDAVHHIFNLGFECNRSRLNL